MLIVQLIELIWKAIVAYYQKLKQQFKTANKHLQTLFITQLYLTQALFTVNLFECYIGYCCAAECVL